MQMEQDLSRTFREFATNPVAAAMSMRRLLESDRQKFFESALPLLRAPEATERSSSESQGFNYLLTLLLRNDLILGQLTNTSLFSFSEAVSLARQLLRIEPLLDIHKVVINLLDTKDLSSPEGFERKAKSERGIRLLEIMAAISDGARILPVVAQLLQHPDSRVRSKAALLVGRSNKNYKWVEQRMSEDDARVRANSLECLWDVDSEGTRNLFWVATADPDNRVAGNAVFGLYHLGEPGSIPLIIQMLDHPQTDFRITATWVMGQTGDPRFLPLLARLMSDPESKIRSAVFRAIGKLKQNMAGFSTAPLLEIRTGHTGATPEGCFQVCLSVCHPGQPDQELTGLKPTQFVVYDDSKLIAEYEVSEHVQTESLALAFALPSTLDKDAALHQILEQAFTQAMHRKRKNDAWLTLRYICEQDRGEPNGSGTANMPVDLRFSTEPETILATVSAGLTPSAAPNLTAAAQTLVSISGAIRWSRNVVLVHDPAAAPPSPSDCQEMARAARTAKTRIHAIAAEHIPALAELCQATGGFVLRYSLQELAAALEALLASLNSHYQLRLGCQRSGAALKIQIFSKQGTGEKIIPVK